MAPITEPELLSQDFSPRVSADRDLVLLVPCDAEPDSQGELGLHEKEHTFN